MFLHLDCGLSVPKNVRSFLYANTKKDLKRDLMRNSGSEKWDFYTKQVNEFDINI